MRSDKAIYVIIIISNYIKVRPKASGAGLVCRTERTSKSRITRRYNGDLAITAVIL